MNIKSIFSSKVFWLAIAQAVAGILTIALAQDPALTTVGWVMNAKSVLDIILRFTTTQAVYLGDPHV